VKWRKRETDHWPPSTSKVKLAWNCTSTPQYVFMAWYFVKHRENFSLPYHDFTAAFSPSLPFSVSLVNPSVTTTLTRLLFTLIPSLLL
jgi:hypothetical protein